MIGNGTIDGAAWSGLRRKPEESIPEGGKPTNYATEIYLMYATDCQNLLFDGVVLRDPTFWNTRIFRSREVRMENLKVLNDRPERIGQIRMGSSSTLRRTVRSIMLSFMVEMIIVW